MRRIVVLLLLCCLCCLAQAKGTHGHHSQRGHHSKSKAPKANKDANKTVHVKGYTRKDGTYVAPYDRSAPGTATTNVGGAGVHYRKDYMAEGFTADSTVVRDKHGKIKRSKAQKAAFQRENPCPSTGRTTGKCPGYVVDHVKALECGGADSPSNMQWQTVTDAKAKDKTEGQCRL